MDQTVQAIASLDRRDSRSSLPVMSSAAPIADSGAPGLMTMFIESLAFSQRDAARRDARRPAAAVLSAQIGRDHPRPGWRRSAIAPSATIRTGSSHGSSLRVHASWHDCFWQVVQRRHRQRLPRAPAAAVTRHRRGDPLAGDRLDHAPRRTMASAIPDAAGIGARSASALIPVASAGPASRPAARPVRRLDARCGCPICVPHGHADWPPAPGSGIPRKIRHGRGLA